jgi:hypothetical protein
MSNNNVYPIQLLNDIHNWYPDILYNPGRFHSVQDLLDYIRSGADVNPYTRGLTLYNSWRYAGTSRAPSAVSGASTTTTPHNVVNPYASSTPTPAVSIPSSTHTTTTTTSSPPTIPPTITSLSTGVAAGGAGARLPPATSVVSIFEYMMDNGTDITPTTNIRASIPLTFSDTTNNRLGTSILSALLGLSPSSGGLESFLNQNVTVRPSQEQIDRNTTLSTAGRTQDDNCAICQDSIDSGQEMRRINHCSHLFHKECIDTWLATNVHCPTCRHDIRESDDDTVIGVDESSSNDV